jgi:hypothetical protein
VNHPAQRQHRCLDGGEQSLHLRRLGHVHLGGVHLHAIGFQASNQFLRRGIGATAAHQRQMARALGHQPVGHQQPQTAQPAGNQVGGVRANGIGLHRLAVRLHHGNLADVLWPGP